VATLGFWRGDFEVFAIEGFNARMEKIYERIRPRMLRLGREMAPELSRKLHMDFYPHVAKHMRRTVNPPDETWTAFGPSPKGYKRYAHLALCISGAGIHTRLIVNSEAGGRSAMARLIKSKSEELEKSFRGARVQQYKNWDCRIMPASRAAGPDFFDGLADALAKKTGGIDVGFGWTVRDALNLDRAEVLDAFAELEPLYRLLRSATP
jgi:uncharacterized protein YktB (UPF0637 family)